MINQKGFTLIELLVVVAIIGILAAVGVLAFTGFMNSAKVNAVKANGKMIIRSAQAEIMKCVIGDSLAGWNNTTHNPPLTVAEVPCNHTGNGRHSYNSDPLERFRFDFGVTFARFSEQPLVYPNPMNSEDNQGGFVPDSDPPSSENIGRVNCSVKNSSNIAICYARWGSGENDYETYTFKSPYD